MFELGFLSILLILDVIFVIVSWVLMFKWTYNIKNSTAETVEAVDYVGDVLDKIKKRDFYQLIAVGDFEGANDYTKNRLAEIMLPFYINTYNGKNLEIVIKIMNKEIAPVLKVADRCCIEVPAHLRDGKIFIDYMNRFHPKGLKNE